MTKEQERHTNPLQICWRDRARIECHPCQSYSPQEGVQKDQRPPPLLEIDTWLLVKLSLPVILPSNKRPQNLVMWNDHVIYAWVLWQRTGIGKDYLCSTISGTSAGPDWRLGVGLWWVRARSIWKHVHPLTPGGQCRLPALASPGGLHVWNNLNFLTTWRLSSKSLHLTRVKQKFTASLWSVALVSHIAAAPPCSLGNHKDPSNWGRKGQRLYPSREGVTWSLTMEMPWGPTLENEIFYTSGVDSPKSRVSRSPQSYLESRELKPLEQKVITSECCVIFHFEQKIKEQHQNILIGRPAPAPHGRYS